MGKKRTRDKIRRELILYTTVRIECGLCEAKATLALKEHDSLSPREFSLKSLAAEALKEAYRAGWRYGANDEYAVEGVFCPVCMDTSHEVTP